jgi:ABC-2 type transport system permease protein
MMKNKLINIWTIATKDILDAFRNKLMVSVILGALVMLVMPKWLGAMIAPATSEILVYDASGAGVLEKLQDSGKLSVVVVTSEDGLIRAVLGGVAFSGMMVPEDFQHSIDQGNPPLIRGYITWSNRGQIPQLKASYQAGIENALGTPVEIDFESHLLYPEEGSFSMLGISFLTMLVVVLMIGISLVPYLMFEEKQTKTLDALLVSPATEAQLVIAKALVGLFYTMVVSAFLFALNWKSVVHWELTVLFVVLCGLFAVSIGLIIGSFFERQQDVTGLITVVMILFSGAAFVRLVDLDIPTAVETILYWVPTNWLFNLLQTIFYQNYSWGELLPGLLSVGGITILLYMVAVWKVRRSDR